MAVIQPVWDQNSDGSVIITWGPMTTSDSGAPVDVSRYQEKTIHVVSAGAGTAQVQGGNDGTNFVSIGAAQAQGTLVQLAVNPRYLQISAVAGATSTVYMVCRPGGR